MYDFAIIGGGIVGLSTAWQLLRRQPGKKIVLLEKESDLGFHQTGHNSGVIHAGIYYEPGSQKAEFCREGVAATIAFCQAHSITFEQCGKLLVATSEMERQRMTALYERARQNALDVELLDAAELKRREPAVVGIGAIFMRTSGIVDYRQVCDHMATDFNNAGGEIRLGTEVRALHEDQSCIHIETDDRGTVRAKYLIACGGLMADRLASMQGLETDFAIIPYRGEYFRLPDNMNNIVQHLIYPIPDPALPFLGVHLTRMIDGSVTVGPNAVQGWKREGYGRINLSVRDITEMLAFPGFWRASRKHLVSGIKEMRNSLWRRGYLREVQKYCPDIQLHHLLPHPTGVRAQAVLRDGSMVHDFLFAQSPRSLHVCNAPSPAATAAIPIGKHICNQVIEAAG